MPGPGLGTVQPPVLPPFLPREGAGAPMGCVSRGLCPQPHEATLSPTARGPEGVKGAAGRGFPGRTELALCRQRSWLQAGGHTRAKAPPQGPLTGPPRPPGQQDPRSPSVAAGTRVMSSPCPAPRGCQWAAPSPVLEWGPLGRATASPPVPCWGTQGPRGSGVRAQVPPHPPWEDECGSGARLGLWGPVGTVMWWLWLQILVVTEPEPPWHPHPPPWHPGGLGAAAGALPYTKPPPQRDICPVSVGRARGSPRCATSTLYLVLAVPGLAGAKTLLCEPSGPAVAPPRAPRVPTFAVCW